jgi:hypothetical protein
MFVNALKEALGDNSQKDILNLLDDDEDEEENDRYDPTYS